MCIYIEDCKLTDSLHTKLYAHKTGKQGVMQHIGVIYKLHFLSRKTLEVFYMPPMLHMREKGV